MKEVILDLTNLHLRQQRFLSNRVGTDGPLTTYDTPEYIINRGIIGEAVELYEAVNKGDKEHIKEEISDIFIFAVSLLGVLGIEPREMNEALIKKFEKNEAKYDPSFFAGTTCENAIMLARQAWNMQEDTPGTQVE